MRTPSAKDIAIVLLHALVLWVFCGATIGIGRALVGIETTLIVHALVVPVFASLIAIFYFRVFGHFAPVATATFFTGLVIALDAGLVRRSESSDRVAGWGSIFRSFCAIPTEWKRNKVPSRCGESC